ncbi:MAG: tripartite tricarboxylate transporter permease [Desulfobacteraceae bacterium]
MDIPFDTLVSAAAALFSLKTLGLSVIGVMIGIVGGAMPGISASVTIALVLPMTFVLDPLSALVMLGAIYMSAEYGGSISAVLINTPGTPAAICTAMDGYPLSQQGRAREALYMAVLGSSIGGFLGVVILLIFTPPLAALSLKFNSAEMFWLAIAGLAVVCNLSAKDFAKGVIAACIGLWLATIGADPGSGYPRFSFGIYQMEAPLPLIPMLLGFFAVSQMFNQLGRAELEAPGTKAQPGALIKTVMFALVRPFLILRSSLIGVMVGILPGAGASIASFVAYGEAKRWSSNPDEFGKGSPEGILASETSNNAMVGGSLVPLLAFGIPGSASAAILLGALTINGLIPGPDLFEYNGEIVYGFMLAFIPTVVALYAVGTLATPVYSAILTIRPAFIIPSVLVLAFIGSFAVRGEVFDVGVATACGLLGFVLLRSGFKIAPIILGIVLGPLIEENFIRSLTLVETEGSVFQFFFGRPICQILILITITMVVSAFWREYRKPRSTARNTGK